MRIVWSFITTVVLLAIIVAIGFLSVGFYLSPQDKLARVGAIVAISGGETDARALEAVQLYKQGLAPIIIFAGAAEDTSGPSNAAAMRSLAIERGVPAKAIQVEETSRTTAENAIEVAPIITASGIRSLILVTSPYHQRRASIEFGRALGPTVNILNHSAPDRRWRRSQWWATPYSYTITISELQKTLYVLGTNPTPTQNP